MSRSKPGAIREVDFRRQIVGPNGIATMLGWKHAGFRAAQTEHGWRTPTTGELGKGFPDLTLVRVRDQRLVFVELKAEDGRLSVEQEDVLMTLTAAGQECHVWRPSDLDSGEITRVLG